jgi:hypothetical protein
MYSAKNDGSTKRFVCSGNKFLLNKINVCSWPVGPYDTDTQVHWGYTDPNMDGYCAVVYPNMANFSQFVFGSSSCGFGDTSCTYPATNYLCAYGKLLIGSNCYEIWSLTKDKLLAKTMCLLLKQDILQYNKFSTKSENNDKYL